MFYTFHRSHTKFVINSWKNENMSQWFLNRVDSDLIESYICMQIVFQLIEISDNFYVKWKFLNNESVCKILVRRYSICMQDAAMNGWNWCRCLLNCSSRELVVHICIYYTSVHTYFCNMELYLEGPAKGLGKFRRNLLRSEVWIGDTNDGDAFAPEMVQITEMLSPHHSYTDDSILHHFLSHFSPDLFQTRSMQNQIQLRGDWNFTWFVFVNFDFTSLLLPALITIYNNTQRRRNNALGSGRRF